MSSASVTSPMRVHGWNVHFLVTPSAFHFAGMFQQKDSDMVTFRDVVTEMRLCFDIETRANNGAGRDPWSHLGFFLAGLLNHSPETAASSDYPVFVSHEDLDRPVPAPPASTNPGERPIVRFHLVQHTACHLPATEPLASHLQAGCAQHIPRPIRRRDARYLPPKKPSSDPRFSRLPLRRKMQARGGSQSPSKRSASGSVSPRKDTGQEDNDGYGAEENLVNMVAPPGMDIATDLARQTIATFRSSCLVAARQCAVSGKGQSWCISPVVGPALQACHIIPQQHYHLYPDAEDISNDGIEDEYSPQRLREAWQRTWSAENGILLLSHLHELFDVRLFSIHPETLRVRVFVPYDVICDYHGVYARLPANVDRTALRHHYDMCCIENMAAKMPLMDSAPGSGASGSATPGSASPFSSRVRMTAMPDGRGLGTETQRRDLDDVQPQGGDSDPSKKVRPIQGGSDCPDEEDRDAMPLLTDDDLSERSSFRCRLTPDREGGRGPSQSHKRKRTQNSGHERDGSTWINREPYLGGCLTPRNELQFLADVNWKLKKARYQD